MYRLAFLAFLLVGLTHQAIAQPFYEGETYLNRGVLNDQGPVIEFRKSSTDPENGIFANLNLTGSEAVPFFKELYPRIEKELVDTGKYTFFLRPRTEDPNSALLFAIAHCSNASPRQKLTFIKNMVVQGEGNGWPKRRDPSSYLLREATDQLRVKTSEIRTCIAQNEIYAQLAAYEREAVGKLYRSAPFPSSHLFVNEHFFPGIFEKPLLQNTFMRAARKIAQPLEPLSSAQKEVLQHQPFDYVIGSETAPVKIIRYDTPEFRALWNFYNISFPKLKKEYIDKGLVNFRLRPYPWFENGNDAVNIAMCLKPSDRLPFLAAISQQSAAWQSSHGFWVTNNEADELFLDLAKSSFDTDGAGSLRSCADSARTRERISRLQNEVNDEFSYFYSPTIFVNNNEFTRNLSKGELIEVIEDALNNIE